jgi:hypothetical protein
MITWKKENPEFSFFSKKEPEGLSFAFISALTLGRAQK